MLFPRCGSRGREIRLGGTLNLPDEGVNPCCKRFALGHPRDKQARL